MNLTAREKYTILTALLKEYEEYEKSSIEASNTFYGKDRANAINTINNEQKKDYPLIKKLADDLGISIPDHLKPVHMEVEDTKPTIEEYKIEICVGRVLRVKGEHPLSFLTDQEKSELDIIGYTGRSTEGLKVSKEEYLNSLGKGNFIVKQTKRIDYDFREKYTITRETIK